MARDLWEALEDRDGTWSVWHGGRVQSTGHPDRADAMSYIRRRSPQADVTAEDRTGRTELLYADDD